MSNLNNVIITGGSKGIGAATAKLFAQQEEIKNIFILDLVEPEYTLEQVTYFPCDMSQPSSIEEAVKKIFAEEEKIDSVVSNAGIHFSATIEETTLDDYHRVLNTNLTGTFWLLKSLLPTMRQQQGGSIVLLGSDQTLIGKPRSAAYGISKSAIGYLTKSVALDYAKYGIRINCVCAGTINTPLLRDAMEKHHFRSGVSMIEIEKEEARAQPLNRVGSPEEVANLIFFLCSDKASYMTGSLVAIDGGYTCR
ncbi:MAG: SDR family oxidoreductase [Gammaproteobacteria bacterium]|nr:SDR family oxidoreductase [Gammaproteobacteria bacterium]